MLTGWRKTVSKFFIIPQRVILSIMGFLAIVNAYTMRVILSVAITRMVVKPNSSDSHEFAICEADESLGNGTNPGGEYEWDQELQGIILSSFYWGYAATHLPGGLLAEKFGGKWTLGLGILSTAVFTLLTPVAVDWGGATALIVLRALMGLGEGTTFPALSALLASWIPKDERSKLGSFVFGGGQIGTIVGTALAGLFLDAFEGWGSVFYFFGGIAILWFILFTLLCYSDPDSHPFISDKEKEFLQKELGQLKRDKNTPPTPWIPILTSVPMMALVCAQIGHDWGFYALVTDLPKYMNDVLLLPVKENGLYSALPYLVMWIVSVSMGFLSDWLIIRKYLNITNARKIFTAVGAVFPAIFIILASYADCDTTAVIIHFTFAMGFMGTFYPGMKVNPLDLSPNYAATLMAITNGIGALTGIIVPYVIGVMTPNSALTEWREVFWITFGIFMVTTVVYVIWASGEVQPWNNPNFNGNIENGKSIDDDEDAQIKKLKEAKL